MRVVAEVPAWMIADGEYGDVAVGARLEFGFALVPTSLTAGFGSRGLRQSGDSARTTASGMLVQRSPDVPPILDEGYLFPILATTDGVPAIDAEVEGQLLVEPFLWAADGLLWPQRPEGVRLWTVRGISQQIADRALALDALPRPEEVEHESLYIVRLERP